MNIKIRLIITFLSFSLWGISQGVDFAPPISVIPVDTAKKLLEMPDQIPDYEVPEILYTGKPEKYVIQDIKVIGATGHEDAAIISFSGLKVGEEIEVPGEAIREAIMAFWNLGLYSNVKILATRMVENKVWLEIQLQPRPRITDVVFKGVKKSERNDLEKNLNLRKGSQMSTHISDRIKIYITRFFDEKGFKNVDIDIVEEPNPEKEGEVFVYINIDKKTKTKIEKIYFDGNENVSNYQLRRAMKKTNERFNLKDRFVNSWLEFFSTKKFTTAEYEEDKKNLINKYYEYGYRDAVIVTDSVVPFNEKRVNIHFSIEEGRQFFLKDIRFVGNTKYPTALLNDVLNMKPGEVYNLKKLMNRVLSDDNSVWHVYQNTGYLFSSIEPVEVEITDDSVSLEIRINEGVQATVNKVIINGNDRLYEDIVRRELRTKPGDLFSREDLIRSLRELAQMGHFDIENSNPDVNPNMESGTVDLLYNLTPKENDQFEFSLGWGQTGMIGRIGLKFTNFAMGNLLRPNTYTRGIIPRGEGQTLNISGQTNAQYYQAYSISFMDPWFGGKRPNTLSVSTYYSRYTDVNRRYYANRQNQFMSSLYNPSGYYNQYYDPGYSNSSYESAYDKSKYMQILGFSMGYGKRLNWPDDFFFAMLTLNYQMYMLHNWGSSSYIGVSENGNYNDLNLDLTIQRNSIDNPVYSRRGSQFMLSASSTFPYSMVDGKDYANITSEAEKFKFVEYYKVKFKSKVFIPLLSLPSYSNDKQKKRTPVLMTRVEVGWIGDFNKNKKSPFQTYYVGGDGMTGGYDYYQEIVGLRGYSNGSISYNYSARAYSRLSFELRYPILFETSSTIYALAFGEAGDAWSNISDFNPFNMKRSAGVGVRLLLPMIGLMGIDWAYGFDKPFGMNQRGGSNFHFILGQEF